METMSSDAAAADDKTTKKGKEVMTAGPHRGGDDVGSRAGVAANYNPYPKPLAKYEEVMADPKLFRETLEKLHSTMRTKFMVPIIGGKDLDLHRLFVEVTSRGGIEKVIGDRRWKEVTAAFSFPSTATNASFVLRKYYISLLRHYEQIYYFGLEGWSSQSVPTTVPLSTSVPSIRSLESLLPYTETKVRKRRISNGVSQMAYPQVAGVIDGKFEHGYFVTVTVGSTKLRGVLYHIPEQAPVQPSQDYATVDNSNPRITRRRRRRKKLSKRDPTHPKPNRSGYNFFFQEQHARLKPLYPGKDREISRMIGELWNKLTETEKAVYQERGIKDRERYKSEMAVYKERLKASQIISTAVPLQQRPAEPERMMEITGKKLVTAESDSNLNENGFVSDGIDSEADEGSEMETSQEVGGTGTGSTSLAEPSNEGDGFELRMRENCKLENDHHISSLSEDEESMKVMEPSTDNKDPEEA